MQENTNPVQFVPGMRFLVFDFGVDASRLAYAMSGTGIRYARVLVCSAMSGTGICSAPMQCPVLICAARLHNIGLYLRAYYTSPTTRWNVLRCEFGLVEARFGLILGYFRAN
eukprot:1478324-Rhodomonas_salina.1